MQLQRTVLALALTVLNLGANSYLFGQLPSRPHKGPVQLQNYEQFAAYWTTEAGWNTDLHLRNNLISQDLTVTASLRTPDGSETALSPVTIHSADVITVDLRSAIASAAPQLLATYGSIVFRYQAPVSKALYAAVMIELPGTPIEFHTDAFLQPYKWVTGSREGIWWQPRDSLKDFLVLTNTGDSAVDANLILYDPSGKAWQQKLTLGARQTTRLSVRNLLQQAGLAGSFGGIKIDASKGAGYLDSTHFVYDESSGFVALMTMFDHHPNATLSERSLTDKQWTIRAPMLALTSPDPALALPSEAALQPTVLLRNASPNAYTAQITFNWRSDATTGKGTTAVPLQPYETRLVDVAAMQQQGAIPANARWAYISITAPVKPDELLAVAASYNSTGHYGAQTPFTDQVANYWEGGKWEVDATHNTIIAVGNAGTVPSKAQLTFYHSTGTGKYQIEKTLAPDEQMWIDMGKLIRNQVADKNSKTIPTSVVSGTYELRSLTNTPKEGLFEGKLVVDKTYGHAAHGCMTCCGYPGKGFMYPDPFNFNLLWYYFDNAYVLGTNPCTGQDDDITAYYTSWWTGNTQVATADMNQIAAVGAGSTSSFGSGTIPTGGDWESRHCPNSADHPSGGVNVEVPDHMVVTSDEFGNLNCSNQSNPEFRSIKYTIIDTSGAQITTLDFQFREAFTNKSSNSCGGPVNTSESCGTLPVNNFVDSLTPGCFVGSPSTPCGWTADTQQWQWCSPSGTFPSVGTPGALVVHNDIISVGGNYTGFVTGYTPPK
jgi:hypothetical protein